MLELATLFAALAAPPDFLADVRPILSNRCFKCHGPDGAARKAELRLDERDAALAVIVPGDAAGSELVARVAAHGRDRMPPEATGAGLTDADVEVLRRWIDAGAEYRPHWAFIAPTRPAPPVGGDAWARNDADRFVFARMTSAGLAPAPEVDRATLLRRVSLDLTGLPPTPEEVDAFLRDDAPDAYERQVDRLLASPHFGERWAAPWLDLARYADTKGYEKDGRRTVWPYRDWVIDAINDDLPFDRFTIEQLAGDLLPDATDRQRLATAFHRNTMTNDEGGTDDEEFRAAAVVDRVNTTMQVWTGLTMNCAQCHTHKFDPIPHEDYYRLYAFFDQTEDADRPDEHPTLGVVTDEQRATLAALDVDHAEAEAAIERTLDAMLEADDASPPPAPTNTPTPTNTLVWFDDLVPPGAAPKQDGVGARWIWNVDDAHSGRRSVRLEAKGTRQILFTDPWIPLTLRDEDVLFAHVLVDPARPPRQVMLQFRDASGSWEHRAYWGENVIPWGTDGATSRYRLGDVPEGERWMRLEVPVSAVGLGAGETLTGWACTQHDGVVRWDDAGVVSVAPRDDAWRRDRSAWEEVVARDRLPDDVRTIVETAPSDRGPERQRTLDRYYRRHVHDATRLALLDVEQERRRVDAERAAVRRSIPKVPVLAELPADRRRTTHVHERGSFLSPGVEVTPGVPAVFGPMAGDVPVDRLGLARWLVSSEHPLTARVTVNRWWEQLFGRGLVATTDDFGTQGDLPSHPELLDWLATELVRSGWSRKSLVRAIVTSATYRQSSWVDPEKLERDPYNVWLARAPRLRLNAETVRDQALAASGLLDRTLHGPPVFPPQPDGLWMMVYSGEQWMTDEGPNRYRRALYTFWRRTSPHPGMTLFDAPSREVCVSRRLRTNTPLQALATLNDPAYVEASSALASRMMREGGADDASRVARGVRLCLSREPEARESDRLVSLYRSEHAYYVAHPAAGRALLEAAGVSTDDLADDATVADAAAWTVVANVLMNLDEFLTRG